MTTISNTVKFDISGDGLADEVTFKSPEVAQRIQGALVAGALSSDSPVFTPDGTPLSPTPLSEEEKRTHVLDGPQPMERHKREWLAANILSIKFNPQTRWVNSAVDFYGSSQQVKLGKDPKYIYQCLSISRASDDKYVLIQPSLANATGNVENCTTETYNDRDFEFIHGRAVQYHSAFSAGYGNPVRSHRQRITENEYNFSIVVGKNYVYQTYPLRNGSAKGQVVDIVATADLETKADSEDDLYRINSDIIADHFFVGIKDDRGLVQYYRVGDISNFIPFYVHSLP